jgi:hypothetical protein
MTIELSPEEVSDITQTLETAFWDIRFGAKTRMVLLAEKLRSKEPSKSLRQEIEEIVAKLEVWMDEVRKRRRGDPPSFVPLGELDAQFDAYDCVQMLLQAALDRTK